MLTQLIRQEALDAYTERWMGEVLSMPPASHPAVAWLGVVFLGSLLAVLIFASYAPHMTVFGVLDGSGDQVIRVATRPRTLHIGQHLRLEAPHPGATGQFLEARVIAIASAPAGRALQYLVTLEIPEVSRQNAGRHFQIYIPLERRKIYQWMLPWFRNS